MGAGHFTPQQVVIPLIALLRASQVCLVTSTYVAQPTGEQFKEVIPWELDLYERDRIIEWCKA